MISTKAFLIRVVVGALLTLALLAAALYWFVVYTIKVVNQSGQILTGVQLLMPGVTRQLGTMPPGGSRWAFISRRRAASPGRGQGWLYKRSGWRQNDRHRATFVARDV